MVDPCASFPYSASKQLFHGPSTEAEQPSWLATLRAWRERCTQDIGLNESLFEVPALAWTQHSYVTVQMHPYDLFFYDRTSGYTVDRWLDDLIARFGGVSSALVWPTYPHLGLDDRNQYDLVRLLPGGAQGVRAVVDKLKQRNVSVLWPYNPWDTATRAEGSTPEVALAQLLLETSGDGFNGDTMADIPERFYLASVAAGRPAALQAEYGASWDSLKWTTLGWGEQGWEELHEVAPRVALFKWLQRRRMTSICRRWDKGRVACRRSSMPERASHEALP